jgi:pimeloyl-ACP methyl ester carboxylesterase
VLEVRAIAEIGLFFLTRRYVQKIAPQGDGNPVMVIPGFMASDSFTLSLRRALELLGYDVYPWNQGTNRGLRDSTCEDLEQRVAEISRITGRKVSLIGHSLGGIYVRAIAHRQAQYVRQIITLGSPFNASFENQEADTKGGALARAYDRMNEGAENDVLPRSDMMCFPPPLPSTSVYSRGDGIIGWQHCLDIADENTENIRVPGTHTAMAHNPLVLYVIAHRLAQLENDWRPLASSASKLRMIESSCASELLPGWQRTERGSD